MRFFIFSNTTETSCSIIRFSAIMIKENSVITPIAENSAAQFSYFRWRSDPAGGLQIKFPQGL